MKIEMPKNLKVHECPDWLLGVVRNHIVSKDLRIEKVYCLENSDIEIFYVVAHTQSEAYDPYYFLIRNNTNYEGCIYVEKIDFE